MVEKCGCAQRTVQKVRSLDQSDSLKIGYLHVSSGIAVCVLTVVKEKSAETELQKMSEDHCQSLELA